MCIVAAKDGEFLSDRFLNNQVIHGTVTGNNSANSQAFKHTN